MTCSIDWQISIGRLALFSVAVFLTAAFAQGCGAEDCDTRYAESTRVHIEQVDGHPVSTATVEYRVKSDEAAEYKPCVALTSAENEPFFVCGYERRGVIEIRAATADGRAGEAEVRVRGDECHVHTEDVTVVVN